MWMGLRKGRRKPPGPCTSGRATLESGCSASCALHTQEPGELGNCWKSPFSPKKTGTGEALGEQGQAGVRVPGVSVLLP